MSFKNRDSLNLIFNSNLSNFFKNILFKFTYGIFIKTYSMELNIYYKYLLFVLSFLKNHTNTQYKSIIDIAVIDYPNKLYRFEVVYNLLSVKYSSRIKLRLKIKDNTVLPSSSFLFKGSN